MGNMMGEAPVGNPKPAPKLLGIMTELDRISAKIEDKIDRIERFLDRIDPQLKALDKAAGTTPEPGSFVGSMNQHFDRLDYQNTRLGHILERLESLA